MKATIIETAILPVEITARVKEIAIFECAVDENDLLYRERLAGKHFVFVRVHKISVLEGVLVTLWLTLLLDSALPPFAFVIRHQFGLAF